MVPTVSIVMPNYNGDQFIDKAISSVVAQDYTDWELIVVDDGSTDSSVFRIQQWVQLLPIRVFLASWSKNSGSPVLPRNYGTSIARGKYIAFLDSDDEWTREKLKKQVAYMDYSDVALTYHNMYLSKKVRGKQLWSGLSRPYEGYCFNQLLFKNFIPSSSVMVNAVVLRAVGQHDSELKVSHDWDVWLRIARKYRIGYLPMVLGTLRLHDQSVVSDVNLRRKESRRVVRRWRGRVPWALYWKCLGYYYLVEIWDKLKHHSG